MSDIGSLENPYVENPFAGRITNVHWKHRPGEMIGGTVVGLVIFQIGHDGFDAEVGLIDPDRGFIYSTTFVSVAVNEAKTVPVLAGGTLTDLQNIGVAPYFRIMPYTELGISGVYYLDHPPGTAFDGGSISNSGILSPYGQLIMFPGPGTWSVEFTVTARAYDIRGPNSHFAGTITGVLIR